MNVIVTGANGFVGKELAKRIRENKKLGDEPVTGLYLLDRVFDESRPEEGFVKQFKGDLADQSWLNQVLADKKIDVVFHLASIPGGTAEKFYGLAKSVNIEATMTLLELCKAQAERGESPPVFVFASTIAVFGIMPDPVTDSTPKNPQMTYGAQKLIGEILVEDFSRRGWVDGRSLRLPGVVARPPEPTGQLSAYLSDIIRELAAGRPFVCPTSAEARTWVASLPCVIDALIHGGTAPYSKLGGQRTFTLPTLHFSMGEMVDAIADVYNPDVPKLVKWESNEQIEKLFGRFPSLETPAADAAGFRHDGDLKTLVRRALD